MSAFCAAVDWGTTSFRLWLLDENGEVLAEHRSDEGLTFAAEVGFEAVLESHLDELGMSILLPVVICGMAGSRQGWKEAAYADAPAELGDLVAKAIPVKTAGRSVMILPGIAQRDPKRPDVMRGEETQLVGLAALTESRDATVCMPGTHSKWVRLSGGRVEEFSTFMTGELFALVSRHSILRHSIDPDGDPLAEPEAFLEAVSRSLAEPARATNRLFALRAGQLLETADKRTAAASLSGLLVGLELAGARTFCGGDLGAVTLIAAGPLKTLYGRALEAAGATVSSADAETCARRGLFLAARALFAETETAR